MAEREEGAAAPNQRQGQNQQQNQQQEQNQESVGQQQQHSHINWSNLSQNSRETRRRCRGTFTMLQ